MTFIEAKIKYLDNHNINKSYLMDKVNAAKTAFAAFADKAMFAERAYESLFHFTPAPVPPGSKENASLTTFIVPLLALIVGMLLAGGPNFVIMRGIFGSLALVVATTYMIYVQTWTARVKKALLVSWKKRTYINALNALELRHKAIEQELMDLTRETFTAVTDKYHSYLDDLNKLQDEHAADLLTTFTKKQRKEFGLE